MTTGTFQDVPLIVENHEVRQSRSQSTRRLADFNAVKVRCFQQFAQFLQKVVYQIDRYFVWSDPSLNWIDLTENVFLFIGTNDEDNPVDNRLYFRMRELEHLLELPSTHTPHTEGEKEILRCQYRTLFMRALEVGEDVKLRSDYNNMEIHHVNNAIWYTLGTEEELHRGIDEISHLGHHFLVRDGNECTVEALIGDVDFVKGRRRTRISYKHLHQQLFIRRNGPHPLVSEEVRKKALDSVFGQRWRFVKAGPLTLPSQVYATQLKKAKEQSFCF